MNPHQISPRRPFPTPLLFTLALLSIFPGSPVVRAQDEAWKDYTNARFGFRLRYPAELKASRAPDNGGGREFHTADKEFSVAASAHFLQREDGDSLERRWLDALKAFGRSITYKKKAASWYVVSGVTKDGIAYYHKTHVKDGNWASFDITYPHAKEKTYSPWVTRIEKGFVPFLDGDYDRIIE